MSGLLKALTINKYKYNYKTNISIGISISISISINAPLVKSSYQVCVILSSIFPSQEINMKLGKWPEHLSPSSD